MKINLFIIQILFLKIKSDYDEECEIGNYCSDGKPCSTNGNCKIDLFNLKNYSIGGEIESKCVCNTGYSSYDIEVLQSKDNDIFCCYELKSHYNAFTLELFLGFGIGHFYIGDIRNGLIKFFLEIFLCISFCFTTYYACHKEHVIIIDLNDLNKKEEYKDENVDNDEIKELNENEKNSDNDNKSKNQNDEEENKINEIINKKVTQCPVYKFFIFSSIILVIIIQIIDVLLMGLGYYTDSNGEKLAMWY